MVCTDFPHPVPTAVRAEDSTLFVALELSRKSWLVATSTPGEVRSIGASGGARPMQLTSTDCCAR
jgi:hypothetical protein